MTMKITQTDYRILKSALQPVLDQHPTIVDTYRSMELSDQRCVWDLLAASRLNTTWLYDYLNDSHIETALRRIILKGT